MKPHLQVFYARLLKTWRIVLAIGAVSGLLAALRYLCRALCGG